MEKRNNNNHEDQSNNGEFSRNSRLNFLKNIMLILYQRELATQCSVGETEQGGTIRIKGFKSNTKVKFNRKGIKSCCLIQKIHLSPP